MNIFLKGKCSTDGTVDFIELRTKEGETLTLDWDYSEYGTEDGIFTLTGRGLNVNGEPCSDLTALRTAKLETVQFYGEEEILCSPEDEDPVIRLTDIIFYAGEEKFTLLTDNICRMSFCERFKMDHNGRKPETFGDGCPYEYG